MNLSSSWFFYDLFFVSLFSFFCYFPAFDPGPSWIMHADTKVVHRVIIKCVRIFFFVRVRQWITFSTVVKKLGNAKPWGEGRSTKSNGEHTYHWQPDTKCIEVEEGGREDDGMAHSTARGTSRLWLDCPICIRARPFLPTKGKRNGRWSVAVWIWKYRWVWGVPVWAFSRHQQIDFAPSKQRFASS